MSLFSIFNKKQPEVTSVAEALAGSKAIPVAKSKKRRTDTQQERLLPEKKRARRRLIGAIAMVLAVVIGLPMVLDSEPKPINKHIVIQIPSKEVASSLSPHEEIVPKEAVEQIIHTSSLSPPVAEAASELKVAQLEAKSEVNSGNKSEAKLKTKPETKVATKTATEVVAKSKLGQSTELAKKEAPPKTKATGSTPARQDVHPAGESARAMAILEDTTPVAPPAVTSATTSVSSVPNTRIVVQVGAFATQEKVHELQGKLTSAGIHSFTQKVATSSGDKIRVRIGPFADKESANKIKVQLEKLGLNGSLISL